MFASLSGAFADPYYTLYLLSLQANNAQIGLVNTLAQLSSAILAMPGAAIADRTGRYKLLSLLSGIVSRLMWLVMLVAPWILPRNGAVWLVLLGWVSITALGAMANAAWTALTADLVPPRLRGGYFASRNIGIQVVRVGAIPLAGLLVNLIGEPGGYQFNLGLAFMIGLASVYFFSTLPEHPPAPQTEKQPQLREVLRHIKQMPTFKRFMLSHATLSLGVMFGAPFIAVYMAEEAHFSTGTIGVVTTANVVASLIGMRIMGRLHDRFGITLTMRFGLGIPLITLGWLWVQHPWQAIMVNGFAALTWAGYNLGAFNLLLASTPDEHRPRYIAVYTTVIAVVSAIGPIVGGWVLDVVGFMPVFSFSAIVRAIGLILFFALVREPDEPPDVQAGNADDDEVDSESGDQVPAKV